MKSSGKQETDLEILCNKSIKYYNENKKSVINTVVLTILVFILVYFALGFLRKDTNKIQNQLDEAHFTSLGNSFLGLPGTPNPAPLEALEKVTSDKEAKIQLLLSAGDAWLKRGIFDLQLKLSGTKNPFVKEDTAPADPKETFEKALAAYNTVISQEKVHNTDARARALYSAGIATEYIASITAGEDEIKKGLEEAAKLYKKVTDECPDSPYTTPAGEQYKSVTDATILTYYKKTAENYAKAPEKAKEPESIMPGGADAPNAPNDKDSKVIDEFKMNDAEPKADAPKADAPKADAPKTEEKK